MHLLHVKDTFEVKCHKSKCPILYFIHRLKLKIEPRSQNVEREEKKNHDKPKSMLLL